MTLPDQTSPEELLAQLETRFSSRYLANDPDYAQTQTSITAGEFNDPPILTPWWELRVHNNRFPGNHVRAHGNDRSQGNHNRFHSNDRSQGKYDRFSSNAEVNQRGHQANHVGRYNRPRPHHAKPYDRPNYRGDGHRNNNWHDRRDGQYDGNRYERNRHDGRSNDRRERPPSAYDRRPGRFGLGYGRAEEEERRYGHQHDMNDGERESDNMREERQNHDRREEKRRQEKGEEERQHDDDTKRNLVPDNSEWS